MATELEEDLDGITSCSADVDMSLSLLVELLRRIEAVIRERIMVEVIRGYIDIVTVRGMDG